MAAGTVQNPLLNIPNENSWNALGMDTKSPLVPMFAAIDGRHRVQVLRSRWKEWSSATNPTSSPLHYIMYARIIIRDEATKQQLKTLCIIFYFILFINVNIHSIRMN